MIAKRQNSRIVAAALALGYAVTAGTAAAAPSLIELSQTIQKTVYKPLVSTITAYALLLFVWGVYRYIAHAGDEKAAAEGSKLMSYGVIILFVMVSVWGLVSLLMDTLGIPGAPSKVSEMNGYDYDTSNPFYNVENVV
jgi:hypothetical protein